VTESFCLIGDVELCYETFGDPADPTMLLIMGLGTQMLGWDTAFCEQLAARGFHVIRYDNRDIGHSTILDDFPAPTLGQIVRRDKGVVAYTLADMAADGVGLLDHLGIERAHLVGASMGGMIAQMLAAGHPDRVRSLASIMSSTGSRVTGQPRLRAYPVLLRRPPRDREQYVEALIRLFGIIGSPGFERDIEGLREMAGQGFDRGVSDAGTGRQMAAILASGNRTPALRRIHAPTVVIHGTADKLVSPSGGKATARAIPGAKLVLVRGMGHDMPRGAWPQIVEAIAENADRAPVAAV
jgi:pimeloyl-ACP methyl ester carboxylesterase